MRQTADRGFRWGLALVVLLATGVPRFSFSHVHAEDDDHHHSHVHHVAIESAAFSDHEHSHDGNGAITSLTDRHKHVHWLCFEFQVPSGDDEGGLPSSDQPESRVEITVSPATTSVTNSFTATLFAFAVITLDSYANVPFVDANLWAHHPPDAPRVLLCDTARRECAGVLIV